MPKIVQSLPLLAFVFALAIWGESRAEESIESLRAEHRSLAVDGRHEKALERAGIWVATARKSGGTQSLAEALVAQGQSLLALDRFEDARDSLLEALEWLGSHSDPALELSAVQALAEIALRAGDYASSNEWLNRAEALWRDNPDPAQGARLSTLRAGIAFRQLRSTDALRQRLRAVEQARMTDDSELLFQTLTNLARAYLDIHDYSAAIPLFTETAGLEGRPLDQVVNRIQLGISQYELNQFDAARESFSAAREAASELGSPRLEGTALGELGLVAWVERRDADAANAYFDQAIERMRSIGDRVNSVAWRTNKALVLRETGRLEEALVLYRELEAELEAIEGQRVWPSIYKGMGQSELGLGEIDKARDTIQRCLAAARRNGDSKRIWECEQLRGRLHARLGDFEAARDAYELALAEVERLRVSLLVGRFKADFFENKIGVFQEYAALLVQHLPAADAARATFELSERARARAFLDGFAQSKSLEQGAVPEEMLQREEQLLREIRTLRAEDADAGSNAARIARLETELDRLSVAARRQMNLPLLHARPSSLQEIQAALAPGEQMLVYWLAEPESHLWRIGPNAIERYALAQAAVLEPLARAAYGELTDSASTPGLTPLAEALLGPALHDPSLEGPLLIVPSGILHYLPFETLPVSDGTLLADRAATTYLPSASALVHLRQAPNRSRPPALLAVGAVPYGAPDEGARLAGASDFGPLPFSGPEVRAVRGHFGYRASNLLMGEGVAEGRLKAMPLDAFSVLHFATHGWIEPASHSASGLLLTSGSGSEDGLLQLREIRDLDLDAELVVLSACQSALGRLVTGEGMVGLTRAFLDAGARAVVASLWNVNDQASADFMDAYYAGLARGGGRAEALRLARNELRSRPEYRHPYYWAAWVLTGDGRDGVVFPLRWERWALLALGLLLIAAIVGWRRVQSRS